MRSHKFHDPQLAKMAAVAAQLGATMDAYTGTGSVTTAKPAYDQLIYFALRPQLYFDACADVEPTRQAMPGSTVIFTIFNDLAPATTPLSQTSDVTAVALSDSQVTVALAEYGNAVITTAKLRGESFVDITPAVVNILGYNAGVSIDEIARNVLSAGSNVRYSTGGTTTTVVPAARTQVTTACLIKGKTVRSVVARLRTYNVPTIGAGYVSYIHPNVSVDLRQTTGPAGWRDPHIYSQPGEIWTGEIGMFEGARFMETPRARVFPTGGHTTTTVVPPSTRPTSWVARRWPSATPSWTATARSPRPGAVPSWTSCAGSSPTAGTGWATTACSGRRRWTGWSRLRARPTAEPTIDK